MRFLLLTWSCCLLSVSVLAQDPVQDPVVPPPSETAAAQTKSQDLEEQYIYVPDGQLHHLPFRVFVANKILTLGMTPKLCMTTGHSLKGAASVEYAPDFVSSRQQMTTIHQGVKIQTQGTLLLFDLSKYPMARWKAMVRVTPSLSWTEPGQERTVLVSENPIYFGSLYTAAAWSVVFLLAIVLLTIKLSRQTQGGTFAALRDNNGRLSLSKTQMAMWTIAIGGVTAIYGLIRLEIPQIPDTLLALMALSLTTSGVSNFTNKLPAGAILNQFKFSDLICEIIDGQESVSLARAQMVFWTVLNVGLFVVKSILDGVLWVVPVEMVTLMGMSQAGYLAPKVMPSATQAAAQSPTSSPNPGPTTPPMDSTTPPMDPNTLSQ